MIALVTLAFAIGAAPANSSLMGGDLHRAILAAQEHNAALATQLDLKFEEVATPQHSSILAAAEALAAEFTLRPSREQLRALASLDRAERPIRDAIIHTIDSFIAFSRASDAAFGRDGSGIAAAGSVLAARAKMLDAIEALQMAVGTPLEAKLPCAAVQLPPVLSIDLTGCPNNYSQNTALIIDAGGDDFYSNNAGGSIALLVCSIPFPASVPGTSVPAALIDLAGNDSRSGNSCGANGGGYYSSGFSYDGGGSDSYQASSSGTNGGAQAGLGFLLDIGGDDVYSGMTYGTNGGGVAGAGLLLDTSGDDDYKAHCCGANGGGMLGGVGRLIDLEGDDFYISYGGLGATGGGNLGVGFLLDGEGTDMYYDAERGSWSDCSRLRRGTAGSSIDLPNGPCST